MTSVSHSAGGVRARDYRDLLIEHLVMDREQLLEQRAADEAQLVAAHLSARAEAEVLRLMLSVALAQLYTLTHTVEGLRRALQALEREGWVPGRVA